MSNEFNYLRPTWKSYGPRGTGVGEERQRRREAQEAAQAAAQAAAAQAAAARNPAAEQAAEQFIAVDNAVNNALDQNNNNAAETNVTNIDRQIPEHIQQLPFYTQQLAIIGANILALARQNMPQLSSAISMIPITIANPTISNYLNSLFQSASQSASGTATEVIRRLGDVEMTSITIGRLLNHVSNNLLAPTDLNTNGGSKRRKSKKSKKYRKSRKSRKSKRRRTHRRK